jgi:hypothetical protein
MKRRLLQEAHEHYSHSLLAGVMIAGAILFTFRWEISAGGQGVYRLDRWSGVVTECAASLDSINKQARLEPVQVHCEP